MDKNKKISLQKEIFKKSINGEGHGAVAGNASAKNLNGNSSERLNHFALMHSNSAAKISILFDKKLKRQKFDLESTKTARSLYFYRRRRNFGYKNCLGIMEFKLYEKHEVT